MMGLSKRLMGTISREQAEVHGVAADATIPDRPPHTHAIRSSRSPPVWSKSGIRNRLPSPGRPYVFGEGRVGMAINGRMAVSPKDAQQMTWRVREEPPRASMRWRDACKNPTRSVSRSTLLPAAGVCAGCLGNASGRAEQPPMEGRRAKYFAMDQCSDLRIGGMLRTASLIAPRIFTGQAGNVLGRRELGGCPGRAYKR